MDPRVLPARCSLSCSTKMKKSKYFHFEDFFLGCLEKKIDILGDFLRKVIKNKGKIVLEARNTENFRLRRAKIEDFIAILILKGPNLGKIAPEGRDFFLGVDFFHFLKSKKKNAFQITK